MMFAMLAMVLAVATPAIAHDEIDDVEVSDLYYLVSDDGSDIEACVDVTVEYTDDHEEIFPVCQSIF